MVPTPTASSFDLLLVGLDDEPGRASEKYEDLRLRLTRNLLWKGCPESQADALADIVLDRIATKLAQGEKIANIFAYAAGVVRFVWLEHRRKYREDSVGDALPETPVKPDIEFIDDADARMQCLRTCLHEIAPEEADRRLILGYYDTESGGKNKDIRKKLAETLGISLNTLKVRACRLRARLETCINECVGRVTILHSSDTSRQEVM